MDTFVHLHPGKSSGECQVQVFAVMGKMELRDWGTCWLVKTIINSCVGMDMLEWICQDGDVKRKVPL